jgi:MFS family permease
MPPIAERWGRKGALLIYFLGALLSVPSTFFLAKEFSHAVLASPIMGFFAAGVTTAFAIYFPELFPTAIRATAQVFVLTSRASSPPPARCSPACSPPHMGPSLHRSPPSARFISSD